MDRPVDILLSFVLCRSSRRFLCPKVGKNVGRQIVDCSCWFYLVSCFRFFEGKSCLLDTGLCRWETQVLQEEGTSIFSLRAPFFPLSECCDLVFIGNKILCFSTKIFIFARQRIIFLDSFIFLILDAGCPENGTGSMEIALFPGYRENSALFLREDSSVF